MVQMHYACMPQWLYPGLYEAAATTFLGAVLYKVQTECQDCSASADQIYSFYVPYQTAAGSWNDRRCVLKADPHVAKIYFYASCEVRLEDDIKIHISLRPVREDLRYGAGAEPSLMRTVQQRSVQRAATAPFTYSCCVYSLFLQCCGLIRRATDLSIVALFGGDRLSLDPPAVHDVAVIIQLFEEYLA